MVSEPRERYSFSKLSTFSTCKHAYCLKYVLGQQGVGNAFSSYGSFIHSILERYAKGELDVWDLCSAYEWEFDTAVPEKFPYNKYVIMRDKYYQQGLDFLKAFQGYENYKILGAEVEFDKDIDDWTFTGVIDLLFEDENGRLIIRDYKSKASFKNDEEKKKYARQLYLYSSYAFDKYGKFPDELQFLMFRTNQLECIPFNEEAYHEAIEWAKDAVAQIRAENEYPATIEQFYCENLCNHRKYCTEKTKK